MALLRIKASDEGLSLEVHAPEFTELIANSEPEQVLFSPVTTNTCEELLEVK